MVHFMRRRDSKALIRRDSIARKDSISWRDESLTSETTGSSSSNTNSNSLLSNSLMSTTWTNYTGTFPLRDHQQVLDYMVDKLPKMDSVRSSLDPIYTKMIDNNPCTSIDISSYHPKDCTSMYPIDMTKDCIMPYYGKSFKEGFADLSKDGSSYANSIDVSDVNEEIRSRGLRFGLVEVREYNRTVGDHPDVGDDGPPLTIDWDYVQAESVPIGQYEVQKQKRRERRLKRRNQKLRLQNRREIESVPNIEFTVPRIKGSVRRELLHLDFDVPFHDLVKAELEVKRVMQQRAESNAQSLLSEKTEELLQAATKKLRRSFMFGYGKNSVAEKESTKYYQQSAPKLLDRRQLRRSKASISPSSSKSAPAPARATTPVGASYNCYRGI